MHWRSQIQDRSLLRHFLHSTPHPSQRKQLPLTRTRHAPTRVDPNHRAGNGGMGHPPQHFIWPLENKAQVCLYPHETAVGVSPWPSKTGEGWKILSAVSPVPSWPYSLFPADAEFEISDHRSGLQTTQQCLQAHISFAHALHHLNRQRTQSSRSASPKPCPMTKQDAVQSTTLRVHTSSSNRPSLPRRHQPSVPRAASTLPLAQAVVLLAPPSPRHRALPFHIHTPSGHA
jgi:hypothetical protein